MELTTRRSVTKLFRWRWWRILSLTPQWTSNCLFPTLPAVMSSFSSGYFICAFITARIRRMGEGTGFQFVSSHLDGGVGVPRPGSRLGGGAPSQVPGGGYPIPGANGGGVPHPRSRWGVPHPRCQWGGYPIPGPGGRVLHPRWGTPSQVQVWGTPSQVGGVPHPRSWWGVSHPRSRSGGTQSRSRQRGYPSPGG